MSVHASQKERHKRKSERKKECQWGREGDRERKGRGRSYTETYTHRKLTEKSKGEKPARKTQGLRDAAWKSGTYKAVCCTNE